MKIIYITEDKLPLLKEAEDVRKMSFFLFFTEVKKFIVQLLTDPISARPSKELIFRGLNSGKLRNLLLNANVITMKERIEEPHNAETGELESRYFQTYSVPKKDFKKKIRRLYQKIFENN